jgi:hypothetical protein
MIFPKLFQDLLGCFQFIKTFVMQYKRFVAFMLVALSVYMCKIF